MIFHTISKLPFRLLYILSDITAFLLYHVFRYRREISYKNLCRAFPNKPAKEIKLIQKSAYLHLTDSFLEILKANTISDEQIRSRVELIGFEDIQHQLNNGDSLFLLTAHSAPIDWVAFAIHLQYDCVIDPVYKPLHSKSLDRLIFAIRSRHGGTPIPYKKLAKDIALRKHVQRCIAMLADLEPRARDHALNVNFLNQPTRFFQGSERVIRLSGLATYFIAITQSRRGHYQACAIKLTDQPTDLMPQQLTHKYAEQVEALIKENPAAWLWTHKRWKNRAT